MSALRELIASFDTKTDTKSLEKADSLMDSLKGKAGKAQGFFNRIRAGISGFNQRANNEMKALEKSAGAVGQVVKQVGGYLGAFAVYNGLRNFVSNFVQDSQELVSVSERLRISTDQLQVLGAVGRSVGLDLNATAGVLGNLRERLDNAVRGIDDSGYMLRRLGVQFRDSNRQARSLYDVFGDVVTGLSRVQKESRRLMLTQKLLGPEGRRFIQLFGDGRDAIRDFQAAMAESGGGINREAIQASLRFSQNMNLAGLTVDSLRSKLAIFLFPKLTALVQFFNRIAIYINKTTYFTNMLKAAFGAMAGYAALKMLSLVVSMNPLLIKFTLIAAAIVILTLLVDDLITLFSGGKSVIGGFIDELFGAGTAATIVEDLKNRFDEFGYFVRETIGYVRELWDLFREQKTTSGETTRTPLRRRNPAPQPGNPGVTPGSQYGVSRLGRFFPGASGVAPVSVPVPQGRTPGRGLPGAGTGILVTPPGGFRGTRDLNVTNRNDIRVSITGAGNPAETGANAERGVRRAIVSANDQQVRDLRESGLLRFAGEGE